MSSHIQSAADMMDQINRNAWRTRDSVRWFSRLEGWTDPGERAAVQRVAAEVRGQPILDLGVGAGRTVPLLRAISPDYTAVDYTPELVAACSRKYPGLRVLCGDARDLSRFAAGAFALVVFSFNGIDAVNPEGRMQILREALRVLRPGGIFLFSTHNQAGPGHGERLQLGIYLTRNPFKLLLRALRALVQLPLTLANRSRYSRLNYRADGYSIMNAAAHNHGILIQYVSLQKQLEQLRTTGFADTVQVYGNHSSAPLSLNDPNHGHTWFHFIARKPVQRVEASTGAAAPENRGDVQDIAANALDSPACLPA